MRSISVAALIASVAGAMFGQTGSAPGFEVADVHPSQKTANPFLRATPPRNGRYELKNATMLDLVRIAYDYRPETIVGGPNWLELDRFDVIAKIPAGSDTDAQKSMLQTLLTDRFKLVVRKDTKPVPTWVLSPGKQPHLKESDGSGETGCKIPDSGGPAPGGNRLTRISPDGKTETFNLAPGGIVQYECRNMTMAAFAAGLRGMLGVQLGTEPVVDQTGIQGAWNFEIRWTAIVPLFQQGGEQINLAEAIEKQLGLKLEQKPVSKEVLVVQSVNRTPTPNPANLAESLPSPAVPKEFEVAEVKLSAASPGPPPAGFPRIQIQPGGRFSCSNYLLRQLLFMAFNARANGDLFAGLPPFVDSVKVDITAKAPPEADFGSTIDTEMLAPLLRSLLADRFGLKYHEEERPVSAYTLVALKPKMKKADPESRIFCKRIPTAPGSPPGSQTISCQNATMALFAEQLVLMAPGFINWPVVDATGLEGGWDFSVTFDILAGSQVRALQAAAGPQDAAATAADPGGGYTLFEAIEKQLGLKLKAEKRPEHVIVIDQLEQKPIDN